MSSTKKLILVSMSICYISIIQADTGSVVSSLDEPVKGNCSCGGFSSSSPDVSSEPLLSQSPGLVVNCDEEGSNTCKNLCLALATATKAKGPEILCARLKDVKELKLSAFYKICNRPWSYADMTADERLCCEDSKVKICESAVNSSANATEV